MNNPHTVRHDTRMIDTSMKVGFFYDEIIFISATRRIYCHFFVVVHSFHRCIVILQATKCTFSLLEHLEKINGMENILRLFFQKFVISDYWLLYGSTSNFLHRNLVLSNMPDRLFIVSHDEKKESC